MPWQNVPCLADDSFKLILLDEDCCIFIQISLKFVPKGSIGNKSPLVQVIAGDKQLHEPMLTWFTPGGGGGGGGGGGALGQVSYGGVQLWGPNPYPILGKTGLRKHTLF